MKLFLRFALISVLCIGLQPQAGAQKKKMNSDELFRHIKDEMDVRHNYPEALRLSKLGVEQYPTDIDFHFLLGRAYLLNKEPDKAQHQLDKVIDKSPGYRDAYLFSANVQMARSKGYNAIRYINMGLARFPADRDLRLKKLNIYQAIGDFTAADQQADSLKRLFTRDTLVNREYINYHNETGLYFLRMGNTVAAQRHFERVLDLAPRNAEALQGVMGVRSRSGDVQSTLNTVNAALFQNPRSYDLLIKKLGLLQEMKRYPDAIETLQQLLRFYPADAKLRQLDTELRLEAARYYKSTDPYYQYQDVLAKSPGNREALDNVISIALSRGMYDEALASINSYLKRSPGDRNLLAKKMGILQQQGKYLAAADIAGRLSRSGSNTDKNNLVDLQLLAARDLAAQELFDSALLVYSTVLSAEPRNEQALNSSINILSGQKKYKAALDLLDKSLQFYPADQTLLLKKASILQEDEQYEDAVLLLEQTKERGGQESRLFSALTDAYLNHARQMMKIMDYDGAAATYNKLLQLSPENKEALTGIINIELSRGTGYDVALARTEKALELYPGDKEFLLKQSEALMKLGRYSEAYAITDALRRRYPYNTQIRSAYLEQLGAEASYQRQRSDTAAALQTYALILAVASGDSTALLGTINIQMGNNNYGAALNTAEQALKRYPQNPAFMIKRAAALEQMQQFKAATATMDTIAKLYPDRLHYQDYLAYLRSRTYHNQMGIAYLNARLDSVQAANIATIQYMRYGKWGSVAGRVNFAGRSIGTGLQFELESYLNHGKKWYSFINVGAANEVVFPRYKANYSLFHNFRGGWEAELGGRFLNFDSINTISGVASLAKYMGDFWLNIRGYSIHLSDKQYFAATLTARQYLNSRTEYFYTVLGYGNSPDDFSRSFQLNQLVSFTTYSVGAGYRKTFRYRNILSISGTWYNQRLTETRYRNQYDIYLSFFRNF